MKNDAIHSQPPPRSFRITRRALSYIPHSLLAGFGRIGGSLHYLLATEKRRNFTRNTAPIAAAGRHVSCVRAFQNHARNVLEMLKAPTESPESIMKRISFNGLGHLDRALEAGRGIILATCHFGNWELSGIALSLRGYPVTTVAGRQLTAGWSDAVKEWKRTHGLTVLSPGSNYRSLYRDLSANRIVVLHIDGDLFSRGVSVPFLGSRREFPRGPAHISRVMAAPLAFAYCRRLGGGGFEVTIDQPQQPPRDTQEEATATTAVIARVEKCILAEPEQWCIFRSI